MSGRAHESKFDRHFNTTARSHGLPVIVVWARSVVRRAAPCLTTWKGECDEKLTGPNCEFHSWRGSYCIGADISDARWGGDYARYQCERAEVDSCAVYAHAQLRVGGRV